MRKAISPVVAIALLLVTAVVGVVGFQSWYNDFSSQVLGNTETQSSNSVSQTGIDNVIGNTLYFRNAGSGSITINQVTVAGIDCSQSGSYTNGVSEIDLYDCMNNLSTTTPEVVVYTDNKIYSKKILVPENFIAGFSYDSQYFVSVWDTRLNSSSGSSDQNTIVLPLQNGGTFNFTVDWGDGTIETITSYNTGNHTYSTPGKYLVKINGTIIGFRFNNGGDRLKLLEIRQWGPLRLGNSGGYFYGASNFDFTGTDNLDLNGTNSFYFGFSNANSFNGDVSGWDMSGITVADYMFNGISGFNRDISNWDVSSLQYARFMFNGASSFNQSLNSWNTSSLIDIRYMFNNADSFTQDLNNWNTSNVNYLIGIFGNTDLFNGDITTWDTRNVLEMHQAFSSATSFNRDISSWNTSNVTQMNSLFSGATTFNQNLSSWDVDQVTSCSSFNNSATSWEIGNQMDFAGQGSGCTP